MIMGFAVPVHIYLHNFSQNIGNNIRIIKSSDLQLPIYQEHILRKVNFLHFRNVEKQQESLHPRPEVLLSVYCFNPNNFNVMFLKFSFYHIYWF